jgi:hypothetical protein
MSLSNDRIDQRPLGIPVNGDYFLFRSQGDAVTKKCFVDPFITTVSGNFEWISDNDPGYAIGNIVTEDGVLYQSMINDNLNIRPSLDYTDDPDALGFSWLRLVQGKSWQPWVASTFIEDVVFVLYSFEGEYHIVQLMNETRPYVSTDFLAEYEADDWKSITQHATLKNLGLSSLNIFIDMGLMKERRFDSGFVIDFPGVWSMLNDRNAIGIPSILFTMNSLDMQTFPANWTIANPYNAEWDNALKHWTPLAVGNYRAILALDFSNGNEWRVTIEGPF